MLLKKLISLLLGTVFVIGAGTGVPPTDADLTYFDFHHAGMMLPALSGAEIQSTEEGLTASFHLAAEGAPEVLLTEEEAAQLRSLIDTYNLWRWADFSESDSSILDGESFSFYAAFSDDTRIAAHGSNAFPPDYWDARDAILLYLESLMAAHGLSEYLN